MKNKYDLFTLLDKPCDPNTQLSREELHQLNFLFSGERGDDCVTEWMQQRWEEDSQFEGKLDRKRIFDCVKPLLEKNQNKRLSFMQVLYRSAAILLLPFVGLSVYLLVQQIDTNRSMQTEMVEVLDPSGIQSRITLSDGSTVILKEGGRLSQKNNFGGSTREIILEGEAFFDIAHNPNKPFVIHTGRIKTTVLGTSFSIKAVPGENSITVTVTEGKVKVEDGTKLLATLGANQQFIHGIEADHWQEQAITVEHEIDWQLHELIFSNMPFGDIAQDLAVRYGINIVFASEDLKQRRITALLDNRDSIDELLKFLGASQNATYTVQGNTYTIKTKN